MKVISTRQPWAHLLASGQKPIENRTWYTKYRGPVLLHAGKRLESETFASIKSRLGCRIPDGLSRGGLIGIAEIADVVTESDSPYFCGPFVMVDGKRKKNYGFVMRNAQALPFIPCDGQLNVYDLDPETTQRLRRNDTWGPIVHRLFQHQESLAL